MNNISFLRFIAIVLITNSHLAEFYPMPALATGGAIGNALFFMLSGYGLFISYNIREISFLHWYKRRIIRIYPSMIIATILFTVIAESAWRTLDLFGYVKMFFWPTLYWFISALMIYYVIFYVLMRQKNYKYFSGGIFILVVPYLYFYCTAVDLSGYSIEGAGYFKWIFYLQTMFFGGYLANKKQFVKTNFLRDGLALVFFIGFYYGILILMSRFGGWQFQAVTHLLMFPILFFFLKFSEADIITSLMNRKYAGALISLVAVLTLEIYLLHGPIRTFPFILNMIFPLNLVVFWIVTIFVSYVLNRAVWMMTGRFK